MSIQDRPVYVIDWRFNGAQMSKILLGNEW